MFLWGAWIKIFLDLHHVSSLLLIQGKQLLGLCDLAE